MPGYFSEAVTVERAFAAFDSRPARAYIRVMQTTVHIARRYYAPST